MKNETNLASLVTAVLADMENRGYSESMLRKHQIAYGRLERYSVGVNAEKYSTAIGEQFIEFVKDSNRSLSRGMILYYERSVRRLDSILSGVELKRIVRQCNDYAKSCHDSAVAVFEDYLRRTGKTERRIRRIAGTTAAFLANVEQMGCAQTESITAEMIIATFEQASDKRGFRDEIGTFFQYAYNRGMTTQNLRHLIPTVVRHCGVPSVYSPEEVERLLAAVDRSAPNGKRDYAIILIAARLGLRASDIAGLRFENLKADRIELVQFKTKQPLTTVLTTEVAKAIFDYTDNGRPKTSDGHIFLDHGGYKAMGTSGIYSLTQRAFVRAGVDCGSRKMGPHALRASLATALLAEGNDYPTIQRVLGQANIESTKFYAKAGTEQLRKHAIPVPPPSGNLAALLAGRGGER
jgi:site-specific recombinase XerD